MKFRLILSFVLIMTLLVTCFHINSFAVRTDGALDEKEWKEAEQTVLISSYDKSNCDVSYGIVYIFCDEADRRIYIGFKAQLSEEFDKDSAFGAAFSVNSDEFIYVTTQGVSGYDDDKYSIDAKISEYSDSVYCVEVALGAKFGLSSVDSLRVRFVDAKGSPSNVYSVNVPYGSGADNESVPDDGNVAANATDRTTRARTTKAGNKKPVTDAITDAVTATASAQTTVNTTAGPYNEETTVITVREMKLQKTFTYTAVCALILTALGICVGVNLARDKEKSKKSDRK